MGRGIGPRDDDFAFPDPRVLLQGGLVQGVGELRRRARVEPDIDLARLRVANTVRTGPVPTLPRPGTTDKASLAILAATTSSESAIVEASQ